MSALETAWEESVAWQARLKGLEGEVQLPIQLLNGAGISGTAGQTPETVAIDPTICVHLDGYQVPNCALNEGNPPGYTVLTSRAYQLASEAMG